MAAKVNLSKINNGSFYGQPNRDLKQGNYDLNVTKQKHGAQKYGQMTNQNVFGHNGSQSFLHYTTQSNEHDAYIPEISDIQNYVENMEPDE